MEQGGVVPIGSSAEDMNFRKIQEVVKAAGFSTRLELNKWMESRAFKPLFDVYYEKCIKNQQKEARSTGGGRGRGATLKTVQERMIAGERLGQAKFSGQYHFADTNDWDAVDYAAFVMCNVKIRQTTQEGGIFTGKGFSEAKVEACIWRMMKLAEYEYAPSRAERKGKPSTTGSSAKKGVAASMGPRRGPKETKYHGGKHRRDDDVVSSPPTQTPKSKKPVLVLRPPKAPAPPSAIIKSSKGKEVGVSFDDDVMTLRYPEERNFEGLSGFSSGGGSDSGEDSDFNMHDDGSELPPFTTEESLSNAQRMVRECPGTEFNQKYRFWKAWIIDQALAIYKQDKIKPEVLDAFNDISSWNPKQARLWMNEVAKTSMAPDDIHYEPLDAVQLGETSRLELMLDNIDFQCDDIKGSCEYLGIPYSRKYGKNGFRLPGMQHSVSLYD